MMNAKWSIKKGGLIASFAPIALMTSLLFWGCAPASNPQTPSAANASANTKSTQQPPPKGARPIPAQFVENVRQSELLGKKIFAHDAWAWVASDMVEARGWRKKGVLSGWVVQDNPVGATVHFMSKADPSISLVRVVFPEFGISNAIVDENPQPLSDTMRSAVKARSAALQAKFPVMSERYNTVVLPASLVGKQGWLVYMLAATTNPDEIILGGHTRIWVSSEGEVKDVFPLSKSIIRNVKPQNGPNGEKLDSMFVTHLVTEFPVETHLFFVLSYNIPLAVATQSGLWRVNTNATITYAGTARE